ncbi:MAG: ATP-binding protein [Prevotella sp.]|nr:ATP-binding protein [Prevotella sp.]
MNVLNYIHRDISATILEAVRYFPVICLTGPRQSGKSTLIEHLFPTYDKFSLEDLNVRDFAQKDPVAFLSQNKNGMILDEVQKVPDLLSFIQGIVDKNPDRKFILSGSSNFTLINSISQSLAGRVGMFDLLPMSLSESREVYQNSSLDEIIFNGLYPAVCSKKNIAKFYYPSYVRTYLERDVRELTKIKDAMLFNTFLRLCAGRIGSIFNASELANEVGVASNTIKAWLSILEASYVITLLPPYFSNTNKRLIKSPKLYFCDTGLACYLLDIESPAQLAHDKMRGHLFENLIVAEALKSRFNQGKRSNLYFYRDSNQNEIDLLMAENGKLNALEIKSAMTYTPDFEKTLSKLTTLVKEPIGQKAIVYAGSYENTAADIQLLNFRKISSDFPLF